MGNNVCTDRKLLTTEEIQAHRLKFKANPEQLREWEQSNSFAGYEHNIRAFSFQMGPKGAAASSSGATKVSRSGVATNAVCLGDDLQLDPTCSYVIMHLQRVPASKATPPKGYDYPQPEPEYQSFANACTSTFTPRGISAMFSVDISALKRRSLDANVQPFVYLFKLYVYNGKKSSSLVSAVAVMSAFTLEKVLLKNTDFVAAMFYNSFSSQSPAPFCTPTAGNQEGSLSSSSRNTEPITMFRDHAFLRSFYNMLSPSEQAMNNTTRSVISNNETTTISPSSTLRKPLNIPALGGGGAAGGTASKAPSFALNFNKVTTIIPGGDDEGTSGSVPSSAPRTATGLSLGIPKMGGGLGLNLSALNAKIAEAKANKEANPDEIVPDEENPNAREERLLALKLVASEVFTRVYVGGEHARLELTNLLEKGVSVVVNAVGTIGDGALPNPFQKEFEYLNLQLSDDPTETIDAFFPVVNQVIETTTNDKKESVYIHCHQGVSRSASLALAYMMWKQGITFETARLQARQKRNIISPNSGFIARLIMWAKHLSNPPNRVLYHYTRYNHRFPLYCFRLMQAQSAAENIIDTASCYVALERADASKPYSLTFFSGPLCDEAIADDARELVETLMPYAFYTNKPHTDGDVTFNPVSFDFNHIKEMRGDTAGFSEVAERVLGVPVVVGRLDPHSNLEALTERYQEMMEERRMINEGASRRRRNREDTLEKARQQAKEEAAAPPAPPAPGKLGGFGLKLGAAAPPPPPVASDCNEVHVYEYPFDGDDQRRIDFIDKEDLQPDSAYALIFLGNKTGEGDEISNHEVVLYKGGDSDVTDQELIQAWITHFVEADIVISECKPTPASALKPQVFSEDNLPNEFSRRIE